MKGVAVEPPFNLETASVGDVKYRDRFAAMELPYVMAELHACLGAE